MSFIFGFLKLCFCCWECSVYVLLVRYPLLLFNVSIVVVSCFVLFPWSCFFRQSNETHRTRTWNKEQEHRKLTKKKKNYQTINTRSKNPKLRTHPTTHNIQQKQTINDKNNIHSAWIISCFFIFFCSPKLCWHCSLYLLLGRCPLFLLCVSVVVFVLLLFFVSDLVFVL